MTDDALDAVLDRVSERVTPDADERERLRAVTAELTARAEAAIDDLPVDADVTQVGSSARSTWLAGDRDIDLFVRFPTSVDRAELERYGLDVGHAVLPDGHEEYAEHPYVKGEHDGFDVDLVPCYAVDSAREIRSAVDRTPFHDAYLQARYTPELAAGARLCKRFMKGVGVYGSDLRTEGFSGYLVELLTLEYGGFVPLVEAAAEWHPPVQFDLRGSGGPAEVPPEEAEAAAFDDPLVVIDPTDPDRNVAAVLSTANLARFQHYCRELLDGPRESLFFPEPADPIDADSVREHLDRRGTHAVAVAFDTPDVVEDQLYPQLRRSLGGVTDELDRRGFDTLRATTFADGVGEDAAGRSVLFVETVVDELPAVERHEGPPVHVGEHAASFYDAYADDPSVYGPFVEDDRYVVERERDHRSPEAFLRSDALFDVALGTHVETALEDQYEVLVGDDVATLAGTFGEELRNYVEPEV
ncbi:MULTISPECIES: CCA tRNA nucleotidyltransferase [Halolamina]|uniref:CCA-adding enzyme n=1 Tax=Halolamina pelagica TaxID=699431 RepID=A0A1I5TDZ4_9EURY|nr:MULTISPECIES: CCA tRNA nucleotidyltransferase [Halolamina]NHX37302.1 CCA tRNA nucleotidyltransferase [Halolamina sp. R1-12]SFP81188.1 tRNA nucleotidyltransferase (CCA-adding enzyme) [Halolamina pelagica]